MAKQLIRLRLTDQAEFDKTFKTAIKALSTARKKDWQSKLAIHKKDMEVLALGSAAGKYMVIKHLLGQAASIHMGVTVARQNELYRPVVFSAVILATFNVNIESPK